MILTIKAREAYEHGVQFYRGNDLVWSADEVPPGYWCFVVVVSVSRLKPLNPKLRNGGKMLVIAGQHCQAVFQRRGRDQGIRQLQTIGQRMRIDERYRPFRDCRREWKNLRLLNGEPALGALQFVLAAAALGEFQISDR